MKVIQSSAARYARRVCVCVFACGGQEGARDRQGGCIKEDFEKRQIDGEREREESCAALQ